MCERARAEPEANHVTLILAFHFDMGSRDPTQVCAASSFIHLPGGISLILF